jgi:Putative peptidoglycan binding domain/Resolvase, N terminal domain
MKTTRLKALRLTTTLITAAVLLSAVPSGAQAADSKFASLEAAPLAKWSGYDRPNGSGRVRHLQLQLRRLGQRPGPIDGLFGPLTEGSVRRFQRQAGLRVDGVVGPKTGIRLAHSIWALDRRAAKRVQVNNGFRIHLPRVDDGRAVVNGGQATLNAKGDGGPSTLLVALLIGLCAAPALLLLSTLSMTGRAGRRGGSLLDTQAPAEVRATPQHTDSLGIPAGTAVMGYVCVTEEERRAHGEDDAAQAEAIQAFCRRRGLRLVRIIRDVECDDGGAADPPGLADACEALARGEAHALVVQRLGRLTRSPARLSLLLRWLAEADRALIAIDNRFDTTTAVGDRIGGALIEVGDWDREREARMRSSTG